MNHNEIFVAVKEIDYIERGIDELCAITEILKK